MSSQHSAAVWTKYYIALLSSGKGNPSLLPILSPMPQEEQV